MNLSQSPCSFLAHVYVPAQRKKERKNIIEFKHGGCMHACMYELATLPVDVELAAPTYGVSK